jgi:hypothetical protein
MGTGLHSNSEVSLASPSGALAQGYRNYAGLRLSPRTFRAGGRDSYFSIVAESTINCAAATAHALSDYNQRVKRHRLSAKFADYIRREYQPNFRRVVDKLRLKYRAR